MLARLAEVGGGAEVLDGAGQFQHRLGVSAGIRSFGFGGRLAAQLLDDGGQGGDMLGLLAAELA